MLDVGEVSAVGDEGEPPPPEPPNRVAGLGGGEDSIPRAPQDEGGRLDARKLAEQHPALPGGTEVGAQGGNSGLHKAG